ncbi:MAG: hypothetical protein H6627_07955 [Calditrichae bacterium]|nr:hypothetical protein [Calditrichota bacterium]MCB9058485.1 hypothetical protein [Calditrichia bacterium]
MQTDIFTVPVFKMQVIKNGKVLFVDNSKTRDIFIINTVNAYDDLKYYRNIQEKSLFA